MAEATDLAVCYGPMGLPSPSDWELKSYEASRFMIPGFVDDGTGVLIAGCSSPTSEYW
jgi:hypothetical protein